MIWQFRKEILFTCVKYGELLNENKDKYAKLKFIERLIEELPNDFEKTLNRLGHFI